MEWSEGRISYEIGTQIFARKCIVLVDNCNWTGHECDVLGVTMDGRIIDVEIKISRSDLKADRKKDKWWNRRWRWSGMHGPDQLMSHPPKVWKHYYALPAEIWKDELFDALPSKDSGVILLHSDGNHIYPRIIRRAKTNKDCHILTSNQILDVARLANIRFWERFKKQQ